MSSDRPPSIRRTLILWFGVLLVGAIATFGGLHAWKASQIIDAGVDASLRDRGEAIVAALEHEEGEGWELDLSEEYLRGLAGRTWFEVLGPGGAPIARGGDVPPPSTTALGFSTSEERRELLLEGPDGSRVRIGRSIAGERAEIRALMLALLAGGAGILVLAILGGWWLANRTLRPIDRMSRTAERLSERDLSGRIDVRDVPQELRGLAETLNETFERLEEAFARQSRFVADASHELRTPVTVVRTQAEATLRRTRSPEEYREALAACLRSAERMSGVVDGLLALARLGAGGLIPSWGTIELSEVVRDAIVESRTAARSQEIEVRTSLDPVRVHGDAGLLGEVVTNLVSNAIRYNRRGGQVHVRVGRENGTALIEVSDDGIGVPEAALAHLFDRFYRVDPARSRSVGGSGLGLAIARSIMDIHEGSIAAVSREGEGSTFTVSLPVAPQD